MVSQCVSEVDEFYSKYVCGTWGLKMLDKTDVTTKGLGEISKEFDGAESNEYFTWLGHTVLILQVERKQPLLEQKNYTFTNQENTW